MDVKHAAPQTCCTAVTLGALHAVGCRRNFVCGSMKRARNTPMAVAVLFSECVKPANLPTALRATSRCKV